MPPGGRWERGEDDATVAGASAIRPFLGRPSTGPLAAPGPSPY
jgi:hypothetical protein